MSPHRVYHQDKAHMTRHCQHAIQLHENSEKRKRHIPSAEGNEIWFTQRDIIIPSCPLEDLQIALFFQPLPQKRLPAPIIHFVSPTHP